MSKKLKAVLIYGGRSTEHEVSCRSAAYIWKNIDRQRFDAFAIALDKKGTWHPQNSQELSKTLPNEMPIISQGPADEATQTVFKDMWTPGGGQEGLVVFNIIHGTTGEDGALQGFLELQGIPFVGPSILGAAVAMDKVVAKQLVECAGLPVVPYLAFRLCEWIEKAPELIKAAIDKLQFPMFVKPASLGSSVGIRRVQNQAELEKAIAYAFEFDERILIELGVDAREIEYACLVGYRPKIIQPGEIGVPSGFYSYEEKYAKSSQAEVLVPAPLSKSLAAQGQAMAERIFYALNLFGMARIDLFLRKSDEQFLFNEANTLPGMTAISQYPKLWEHAGYKSGDIITELLNSALERYAMQKKLKRSV
ncbi:MAG: D-alanine--D-alanine ligase [Proteobacteria bacterium]|nr:D-alanine--D-alanine ligase [Pseudomonadota bacterium]